MNDSRAEPASSKGDGGRHFILLPAVTFLVGLLLGAVLVWVGQPQGSDGEPDAEGGPSPGSTTSAPVSPQPEPTEAVLVPAACLRAARAADDVVRLVRDAVRALGDLDTVRLQNILDRLERLDTQIRTDAGKCRPETVTQSPGASPGPTAASPTTSS